MQLASLRDNILGQYSVMAGQIDLKFSGNILGVTGFIAVGLMKKCMIHFKVIPSYLTFDLKCDPSPMGK